VLSGNYDAAKIALKNVHAEEKNATDFISLYADVLIPVAEGGRNLLQLTKKEISILESLAGKQSPSGIAAENILEFATGVDYPEIFDPEYTGEEEELRLAIETNGIKIYPNPAYGELHIEINNAEKTEEFIVTMYDVTGIQYIKTSLQNNAVNVLPLQSIPSGFYLIKIEGTNSLTIIEKLIKQ